MVAELGEVCPIQAEEVIARIKSGSQHYGDYLTLCKIAKQYYNLDHEDFEGVEDLLDKVESLEQSAQFH